MQMLKEEMAQDAINAEKEATPFKIMPVPVRKSLKPKQPTQVKNTTRRGTLKMAFP